ncbi:hypothetical protein [Moraxella oblonga]|uniref:hypothetical protein n=1 Tax=Moraxella oblonga TaxID=200413 RepID=UPI00082C1628|nr:hypothetical protein [Moraxella oblonga]
MNNPININKPKFNFRFVYIVICLILSGLGIWFGDWVLGETPTRFDRFSYIGTIITILGFIVASCEIWLSLNFNHKLDQELGKQLDNITDSEIAHKLVFIQDMLNLTTESVENDEYSKSLIYFRLFRKELSYFGLEMDNINTIENKLSSYRNQTNLPMFEKKQAIKLLIELKKTIENLVVQTKPYIHKRLKEKSHDTFNNS